MPTPLRVLILEDRPDDAELMLHELGGAEFDPDWTRVETEEEYLANLDLFVDVVLADYSMPQFDGMRALKLLQEQGLDIPFIVVTGSVEEFAIECMKQGAADYILKGKLRRLGPAVKHALEEKKLRDEKRQVEQALHEREGHYRMLFDESKDAIIITNRYGRVIDLNPAAEDLFGYALDETQELFERDLHADPEQADALLEEIKKTGSVRDFAVKLRGKSGIEMDCLATWTIRSGAKAAFLGRRGIIRDITERKRVEEALKRSEARFHSITDHAFDAIVLADDEGNITHWNPAASRIFGYESTEAIGKPLNKLFGDESDMEGRAPLLEAGNGQVTSEQLSGLKKNGERFPLSVAITANELAGKRFFSAVIRDLEDAERAQPAMALHSRLGGLEDNGQENE